MSKDTETEENADVLYPKVAMYGPSNVRGLRKDEVKLWCACGLSKTQPWCDGSHVGTGIKPVKWKVPHEQSLYQICVCKYTKSPPLCDGQHTNLPVQVQDRQRQCTKKSETHTEQCKLCTNCGWVPDF